MSFTGSDIKVNVDKTQINIIQHMRMETALNEDIQAQGGQQDGQHALLEISWHHQSLKRLRHCMLHYKECIINSVKLHLV